MNIDANNSSLERSDTLLILQDVDTEGEPPYCRINLTQEGISEYSYTIKFEGTFTLTGERFNGDIFIETSLVITFSDNSEEHIPSESRAVTYYLFKPGDTSRFSLVYNFMGKTDQITIISMTLQIHQIIFVGNNDSGRFLRITSNSSKYNFSSGLFTDNGPVDINIVMNNGPLIMNRDSNSTEIIPFNLIPDN